METGYDFYIGVVTFRWVLCLVEPGWLMEVG